MAGRLKPLDVERLLKLGKDELIFTNPDGGAFSENAMLAVLDRLGYGHVTVHGFRSTFATWAEECTDYSDGVREAALGDQIEGGCQRRGEDRQACGRFHHFRHGRPFDDEV
ncbi:hypothetical protein [Bradyrhizobium hipponense]|uniref:hypothetical protein n=1 Tax=Bradyrhizobium hipponense TaxID=2605638 RepID=UPI001F40F56E|nr:hypothetical protein [Bradyrhizobium hipponense]